MKVLCWLGWHQWAVGVNRRGFIRDARCLRDGCKYGWEGAK